MRLFKHPVHVMLIHFPSALFPMELVCYGLLFFSGDRSYATAAYYAMTGGVVLGWLAVVSGAMDLIKIPPHKPAVVQKALIHGTINSSVLIAYTVFVYLISKQSPQFQEASLGVLIVKAILVTALIVGNWLGGELILKHNVALDNER